MNPSPATSSKGRLWLNYLCVADASASIDFYTRIFGAEETLRLQEAGGGEGSVLSGDPNRMESEMPAAERPPRRYSDQEVKRLLDRATELQREHGGPEGLTLPELEEIALEAGIDPQLLRRAATELDSRGGERTSRWSAVMGAAPTILLERTVPAELSAPGLESIVVEIQRGVGVLGQPSLVGNTLTWRSRTPNNTRSLQIVVASREGETYIRVEEGLNQLAGSLFGGLMGGVGCGVGFGVGMGVGFGALGSALFAFTFPVGAIAASYLAARTAFSTTARARRRALQDLIHRLADAVTDVARERIADGGEGPSRLPSP